MDNYPSSRPNLIELNICGESDTCLSGGESQGWENTCSCSQVSRCGCQVVTDVWTWHGASWHPRDHDADVMMSRLQPTLHPTCHTGHKRCLSVYIYTCLAAVLICLNVYVFLRFYFDNPNNNVDPRPHSQETPHKADHSRHVTGSRDTWHLCHASVAPVVTSCLLSLLSWDHQSPHLRDQGWGSSDSWLTHHFTMLNVEQHKIIRSLFQPFKDF